MLKLHVSTCNLIDDWIAGLHMSLKDTGWQDEFSTMSAEIKRTFTCAAPIFESLQMCRS